MDNMKEGLTGLVKGLGNRAAKALYGDRSEELRGHVWKDIANGFADSMNGGDIFGPAHERLKPIHPKQCDCGQRPENPSRNPWMTRT